MCFAYLYLFIFIYIYILCIYFSLFILKSFIGLFPHFFGFDIKFCFQIIGFLNLKILKILIHLFLVSWKYNYKYKKCKIFCKKKKFLQNVFFRNHIFIMFLERKYISKSFKYFKKTKMWKKWNISRKFAYLSV